MGQNRVGAPGLGMGKGCGMVSWVNFVVKVQLFIPSPNCRQNSDREKKGCFG